MAAEVLTTPYYRINVLTGTRAARVVDDPAEAARIIAGAKNPLYVLGPDAMRLSVGDKLLIDYALSIAASRDMPICATAHVKRKLLEYGKTPDSTYDIIEIVHFLKMPDWKGVRGQGQHDLVLFSGVRCDLAERGLSTLKHFAPHLRTFAICRRGHPNADYTVPVIARGDRWLEYLQGLVAAIC